VLPPTPPSPLTIKPASLRTLKGVGVCPNAAGLEIALRVGTLLGMFYGLMRATQAPLERRLDEVKADLKEFKADLKVVKADLKEEIKVRRK
jgi:hypothetical protein